MNKINGLDRYLTSEPEDNFTPWVEAIANAMPEASYTEHYAMCFDQSPLESKWLEKLYKTDKTPEECAALILRAYNIYFKHIPLTESYKAAQQITTRKKRTFIPHDVVCELLGQFSFSKNQNKDVQIAEQIASNSYSSMESLLDTIKGEITVKSQLAIFDKDVEQLKKSSFFGKYFTQQ